MLEVRTEGPMAIGTEDILARTASLAAGEEPFRVIGALAGC